MYENELAILYMGHDISSTDVINMEIGQIDNKSYVIMLNMTYVHKQSRYQPSGMIHID